MIQSLDKKAFLDRFWETFGVSRKFSISLNGKSCLYRGPNGLKCAAGLLIPDEDFDLSWEGQSVSSVCGNEVSKYFATRYSKDDMTFIKRVQMTHDGWAEKLNVDAIPRHKAREQEYLDDMRRELAIVARDHDVDWA